MLCVGLEFMILLHKPPEYWDYRHRPPCPAKSVRFNASQLTAEPRASNESGLVSYRVLVKPGSRRLVRLSGVPRMS